eukprot:Selendium_serpulae@DN5361_c0_g1_i5.p1
MLYVRGHTTTLPAMQVTDLNFKVPFDFRHPEKTSPLGSNMVNIFAREVVPAARPAGSMPTLLYLEGGPGFGALRPTSRTGWLQRALEDYRVILIDQRGTGNSTPVAQAQLATMPAEQQADYLSHFRADTIVADCEAIRRLYLGETEKWTLLGQSFGGFIIWRYLSFASEGVEGYIITGGIPPIEKTPVEVYGQIFQKVISRTELYYKRYPEDREVVRKLVAHLRDNKVDLPGGGVLSPRLRDAPLLARVCVD